MDDKNNPPENPFLNMTESDRVANLTLLAKSFDGKIPTGIDVHAMFGLPGSISAEQQQKLDEYDKFSEKLQEVASIVKDTEVPPVGTTMTETEKKLVAANLDTLATTITKENPDISIDSIPFLAI